MLVLLLVFFVFVAYSDVFAAQIKGRLSNFDLKNFTNEQVTDLDLIFSGATCDDITYYFGKNTGIRHMDCVPVGGGKIRVTFSGPGFPVAPGSKRHFGLSFKWNVNVRMHQVFWTKDGVQTGGYIDFTGLNWEGTVDCPVNIKVSRADSTEATAVTLTAAQWAASADLVHLDNMTATDPEILTLDWEPAPSLEGAVLSSPSDEATFTTPAIDPSLHRSVLARYTVLGESGDMVGEFIEQAEFIRPAPTLTEWGLILFILAVVGFLGYMILRRRRTTVSVR
jgi:hypothetical protein